MILDKDERARGGVNTLGMRDLKSSLVYGIKKPYARFDLGTKDTIWKTQPFISTSRNPQLQPSQKAVKQNCLLRMKMILIYLRNAIM